MLPLRYYIKHPRLLLSSFFCRFGYILPDKLYVQISFYLKMGKKLDLSNPRTYNEKLQWLKLYNRRPEYTMMVDKYLVKDYVASIIGAEYVVPTLGVKAGAISKLKVSMKKDIYRSLKEWPYKNVQKRIIAESFVEPDPLSNDLPDYKFFCFDGVVKALFVGTERSSGDVKFDYYDADFNHLDLIQVHPMSGKDLEKPTNFGKMKEIASTLSKGIPHVRVDLYNVEGKIYFGELTFYHHGGIEPFHPEKWDYVFGSWLKLP